MVIMADLLSERWLLQSINSSMSVLVALNRKSTASILMLNSNKKQQ